MKDAHDSVLNALAFDDKLQAVAANAGSSKGHLFQGLLEALREQGVGAAQMENSSKNLFGGSMAAARTFQMRCARPSACASQLVPPSSSLSASAEYCSLGGPAAY